MTGTYSDKTLTDVQKMAFQRLAQANGTVSGLTQKLASSDVAQALPASVTQSSQLRIGVSVLAVSALITVEGNSIRYAFGGAAPTQAGLGHLLIAGASLKLDNPDDIASFQFISATAGQAAVLQVTAGF